ncbi:MAG: ABC transporter substrate-binding protein [Bdellovibrionota bacterium]
MVIRCLRVLKVLWPAFLFCFSQKVLLAEDYKDTGIFKIGVIFPLSGAQQAYGEDALAGVELALQHIQQTEPELARKIQIIQADNRSSPSLSTKAAEKLISVDRVAAILGSITAASSVAIAQVATKAKKPFLIPATTVGGITNMSPYIFRSCNLDSYQGKILAAFARSQLKIERAAVLIKMRSPYAKKIAEQFETMFMGRGGSVSKVELTESEVKSFKPYLKSLMKANPQAIVFPSYAEEGGKLMRQMLQMGIKGPLLGSDGWDHPDLAKFAGSKALSGHFYSVHFYANEGVSQNTLDFTERFKQKVRRFPSSLAAMTYDGTLVLVDAFRKARSIRSLPLVKQLKNVSSLDGVMGEITINKERNAEKPGVIMSTSSEGSKFRALVDPRESEASKSGSKKNAG